MLGKRTRQRSSLSLIKDNLAKIFSPKPGQKAQAPTLAKEFNKIASEIGSNINFSESDFKVNSKQTKKVANFINENKDKFKAGSSDFFTIVKKAVDEREIPTPSGSETPTYSTSESEKPIPKLIPKEKQPMFTKLTVTPEPAVLTISMDQMLNNAPDAARTEGDAPDVDREEAQNYNPEQPPIPPTGETFTYQPPQIGGINPATGEINKSLDQKISDNVEVIKDIQLKTPEGIEYLEEKYGPLNEVIEYVKRKMEEEKPPFPIRVAVFKDQQTHNSLDFVSEARKNWLEYSKKIRI